MSALRKTGVNLLKKMEDEWAYLENELGLLAAADNVPLRSRIEDEEIVRTAEDSNVLEGQSDSESDDNRDGDGHDANDGVREGLQSFSGFVRAMGAAADADSDGEDSGEVVETNPNTGPTRIACSFFLPHCQLLIRVFLKVRVFFGQKHPITIEDLFDWSVEVGWNLFWDVGKRHYHDEMEFYELLTQIDGADVVPAPQETSGPSSKPIEVD